MSNLLMSLKSVRRKSVRRKSVCRENVAAPDEIFENLFAFWWLFKPINTLQTQFFEGPGPYSQYF